MPITITLEINDEEHTFPAKNEVCPRCDGEGTHTNPAIDGNGITAEEFAEDPDFREDYMNGVYDITCTTCRGNRVVKVIDLTRLNAKQKKLWQQHEESEAEYARDVASERSLRIAECGFDYLE